jgi:hypothetical protein
LDDLLFEIPLGTRDFSVLRNDLSGCGYRNSFPELKRPRHDADQPCQTSTEIKNYRSSTSSPPIYLHDVNSDSLAVLFERCWVRILLETPDSLRSLFGDFLLPPASHANTVMVLQVTSRIFRCKSVRIHCLLVFDVIERYILWAVHRVVK